MHEHGIGRELWKVIEDKAKENNLAKITKISIVIGKASGIEKELLVHTMKDHIIPGTCASSAELEFIEENLTAQCNTCKENIDVSKMDTMFCPKCGSSDIIILSGNDCFVKSIEGE
ncbi:MAG: hydrogenase maturation nickel metallochaperone HypA [Endomicrobiaceae bacterium]